MLKWYEPEHWHRLHYGPGINVEALKMKAAQLANTPRHPRSLRPIKGDLKPWLGS
jgi:hypothetical protein